MSKDEQRKQRLAEQLRANLKRRKAQAKARGGAKDGATAETPQKPADAGGERTDAD